MRLLRHHGLSLVVAFVWLVFILASWFLFDGTAAEWWSERAGGHADDSFGALLVIVLSKWLRERGSAQSK